MIILDKTKAKAFDPILNLNARIVKSESNAEALVNINFLFFLFNC